MEKIDKTAPVLRDAREIALIKLCICIIHPLHIYFTKQHQFRIQCFCLGFNILDLGFRIFEVYELSVLVFRILGQSLGFRIWDLGFSSQDSGFRVGFWFRIQCLGFRIQNLKFRVRFKAYDLVIRIQGSGFYGLDLGSRIQSLELGFSILELGGLAFRVLDLEFSAQGSEFQDFEFIIIQIQNLGLMILGVKFRIYDLEFKQVANISGGN